MTSIMSGKDRMPAPPRKTGFADALYKNAQPHQDPEKKQRGAGFDKTIDHDKKPIKPTWNGSEQYTIRPGRIQKGLLAIFDQRDEDALFAQEQGVSRVDECEGIGKKSEHEQTERAQ